MPIAAEGLRLGLLNGVVSYSPADLNFLGGASVVHNKLLIQIFGDSVTAAQNVHDGNAVIKAGGGGDPGFTAPEQVSTSPLTYKSYLGSPAVCSVGANDVVKKIAFALVPTAGVSKLTNTSETAYSTADKVYPNDYAGIPNSGVSAGAGDFGDIFMVITIDGGISVTDGGYLTVKGFSSGVAGSENFTYVTLATGA